ncbi:unnamed protein product [Taenia asiatica]|uniref:REJ domain-containing protein n=1 Tax=Taenia asiatica TaxID=60517 RepID=A0A158R863_TAEAS|nr:unnamed protein product [Taenia asiatica]
MGSDIYAQQTPPPHDELGWTFGIINATYSVLINHRPQGEIVARCEYVHIDGSMVSDEIQIKQATPPSPPKIVALCSGPGAVIFGVTNPLVSAENEATDRIVNQRVLFAPTANGQPRSEKTVDGDEEEIQEALLAGELNQQQPHQSGQKSSERPILSTIPLTNLLPGTNYTFEWSSANQFHLTTTIQFVTATAPLTAPSKPTTDGRLDGLPSVSSADWLFTIPGGSSKLSLERLQAPLHIVSPLDPEAQWLFGYALSISKISVTATKRIEEFLSLSILPNVVDIVLAYIQIFAEDLLIEAMDLCRDEKRASMAAVGALSQNAPSGV